MTDHRRPGAAPQHDEQRPPGALLMLLEGRAPMELFSLVAALPWLYRVPRGDGHPVIVLPGMATGDIATLPLRRYLRTLGYDTHAWGQGLNLGPQRGVIERASDDLCRLSERTAQPVSLVGWSLGGIYARELAKMHPQRTRSVITLGTPFSGHPKATNAWRLYELLTRRMNAHDDVMAHVRTPPPVPTTSIYSRSDGIVAWRCSINEPSPLAENIEVPASHIGMGANPFALYAVADRLAQPLGGWQPFDASGARRLFFRTAHPDASATAA
jgi:pimeloyl-ACP methyl ester carboxylesterase